MDMSGRWQAIAFVSLPLDEKVCFGDGVWKMLCLRSHTRRLPARATRRFLQGS